MFKTTLLAAAALSFMALSASQANAIYGHSYGWSHGGHNYYKRYSWYPRCHYVSRPIKIKLWDRYSYTYYFKIIYRQVRSCY